MRIYLLILMAACGGLFAWAQSFDKLDSELYHGRVKLMSEFMNRFNGDEKNPLIDPKTAEAAKINLCQLFDADYVIKHRAEAEPKVLQFVDSVLANNVRINYSDYNWYATATCVAIFQGKETKFDVILTVEPRGKDMYKWAIADVRGEIFNLTPSRKSEKIMLLPNEHESNFMQLHAITTEKDDYITLYSSHTSPVDRLSVFNTLVYYGYLDIDYVCDLSYTFLQVPGYSFTVKEFERDSTNSGWLIQSWQPTTDNEKARIIQQLYHGKAIPAQSSVATPAPPTPLAVSNDKACAMVNSFVSLLNNYASSPSAAAADSITNAATGRYTFIITDEITNQLAKRYNAEPQNSYRISDLLQWLGNADTPVKSISVTNLQPFANENIRPEYSKGYTLISGDLQTDGDFKLTEQVVFFIYDNQIAGIKSLTNCF